MAAESKANRYAEHLRNTFKLNTNQDNKQRWNESKKKK